jgi:hypothetical protein
MFNRLSFEARLLPKISSGGKSLDEISRVVKLVFLDQAAQLTLHGLVYFSALTLSGMCSYSLVLKFSRTDDSFQGLRTPISHQFFPPERVPDPVLC